MLAVIILIIIMDFFILYHLKNEETSSLTNEYVISLQKLGIMIIKLGCKC